MLKDLKVFVVLGLLLLVGLGVSVHLRISSKTDWQQIASQASVEISQDGTCSGGLIEANIVLTASHCVTMGKEGEYLTVNVQGKDYLARVKKIDREKDLALLEIPGVKFTGAVRIAEEQGKIKDGICTVGNPRNRLPDTLTCGVISFLDRKVEKIAQKFTQLDLSSAPGNSGGMILNEKGEIIGVLVRGIAGDFEFAGQYVFATTLKDIKEFLNA